MGFPAGGTGLALSRGVVSRIDYASYNDLTEGLRIQVDAVAGPGSSGGPALVDGKMVGVVFQPGARTSAMIIPNEEIDAYLEDVKDGRYDGKPRSIDLFQTLVNEALRKKLGLARADRGVMVRRPGRDDPSYPLREGDVVTRIGAAAIDNEGMVDFEGDLRLPFTALIPRLAKDGAVPVGLIRDGKPLEASHDRHPRRRPADQAVPGPVPALLRPRPARLLAGDRPGGVVLRPGQPVRDDGQPAGDPRHRPGRPSPARSWWWSPRRCWRTRSCGATRTRSARWSRTSTASRSRTSATWSSCLRDGKGEFLTIRFHGEVSETVVFPRKAVEEVTAELMAENGIPKRGTNDVMAVWNSRAEAAR